MDLCAGRWCGVSGPMPMLGERVRDTGVVMQSYRGTLTKR
ncbi:Uncharacterised protein [Serratia rubidaea]|uniref:Uncharacterized protein n=1 Tax=Serratia rubidaea TaxID=61652 RepID=A0A4U9HAR4_SERRU|nr:Uncharacterised protein [Serratia rubidaea]CAI1932525.1 Uncharacterised protein [Serratia rubidaea]VTP60665.1 Uncharacterised protein [Serratia rubidaea]